VEDLVAGQLNLAKGVTHVFRRTTGERGGRSDPELVTDMDELHEAIQSIHAGGGYGEIVDDASGEDGERLTHRYYFLTTKRRTTRPSTAYSPACSALWICRAAARRSRSPRKRDAVSTN